MMVDGKEGQGRAGGCRTLAGCTSSNIDSLCCALWGSKKTTVVPSMIPAGRGASIHGLK